MISKSAAQVAISIATNFDARRIALVATEGTPLAGLVSSSYMVEEVNKDTEYTPDEAVISTVSAGYTDEGTDTHTQELEGFVAELVPLVAQHLDFAKNVVRPVITEVVQVIEQDIANLPVDVQYNLEIVKKTLPAPLISSAILELTEKYKDVNYEVVRSYLPLKPKTTAEMIELMSTGAKDTDEAIALWVAEKGEVFLSKVTSAVFSADSSQERFDQLIQSTQDGLDTALVVFLVCEKIYNVPEEGVALSLVDYNQIVADLRNQAALRIIHGIESYEREVKTGSLITRIDDNSLSVNAQVYARWQESGGQDAVLFGSALSTRPARFELDLNERALEFKAQWEQRNRILSATERNNRFANYTRILSDRTTQVVFDNMADIFASVAQGQEINKDLPVVARSKELIDEFVSGVVEADFKDLWVLVTKLVCRSAFHYTDAEKILMGIDQACKDNPDIEVREAALISVVEYVTDWVCSMIEPARI